MFALVEGELPDVAARATSCAGPTATTPRARAPPRRPGLGRAPRRRPRRAPGPPPPARARSGSTGAWSAGSPRGRRPSGRSTTPTTPCCASSPVRPPRRCRTARCSTTPPACTPAPPARPPTSRPATPSCWPPRPSWARRGSARCSTTSATASPASCTTASPSTRCPPGMHIELVRSEIDDDRLRTQLDTAKDLTRRAVEQLRSAIYALNDEHAEGEDLPSMLRRLSRGAHARRAVRRGAHRRQAGGAARGVRAVALPHRGRGAVQHGRARRGEPRGRAAGLHVRARCGSRSPTTASGGPRRSAAACARRAPPRPASTAGW